MMKVDRSIIFRKEMGTKNHKMCTSSKSGSFDYNDKDVIIIIIDNDLRGPLTLLIKPNDYLEKI